MVLEPSAGIVQDSRDDTNAKTVQLAKLLTQVGPDIPEISRMLGQFKESVRYRYKEKILGRDLTIQAAVATEKLGLKRVVFVVEFAKDYKPYASTILTAMSDLCYVVYFARTLPAGAYLVNATVPAEYIDSFNQFVLALEKKGLFSSVDFAAFDWGRNIPMRAEFYDFEAGRWEFDWNSPPPRPSEMAGSVPQDRVKFDDVDLLILKELQIDATRPLIDISKKLQIGYKKLSWHYATHVLGKGLIRSYRLNWKGTRYDYKLEKALHRKHRYLSMAVIVKKVNENERMELASRLGQLPFLWFEASGENYYADFAFPVDSLTEALEFLESCLEPFGGRAKYHILDDSNALTFTIPYRLYDRGSKRWVFDPAELLPRFDNLLMKIREVS